MDARELCQRIRELHHRSPKVLSGEDPADAFWNDVMACFQDLERIAPALEDLLAGAEVVPRILEPLRESLRWELELNRFLFPAIQSREPGETVAHHVLTVFGMMSGDMLDRLFNRLVVLAEVLGCRDGSVDFPEEAYLTYQELWGMAQVIALAADEADLDA
jgi:hypothetical protein